MIAFKKYFKGYEILSVTAPLLKLVEALLELSIPLLVGRLIDHSRKGMDTVFVAQSVGLMIVIALVSVAMALVAQYLSAVVAVGVTQRITDDVVRHALMMTRQSRQHYSVNKVLSHTISDTANIQNGLNLFFRLLLRSPFIVGGAVVLCWWISPVLSLYVVGMVVVLSVIIGIGIYVLTPYQQAVRHHFDMLVKVVSEQLSGIRVIRVFQRMAQSLNYFDEMTVRYHSIVRKLNQWSALMSPVTFVVVNVTLLVVLYFSHYDIQAGALTSGQLVAFINYVTQILVELVKMLTVVQSTHRAWTSAKRIEQLLGTSTLNSSIAINNQADEEIILQLHNIGYTYPNASLPAISDVTFDVRQGAAVGIIGRTGSGKTTLANLIMQTLTPTQGEFFSHDLTDNSERSQWLKRMAFVSQQPHIFEGTIRSNVMLGSEVGDDTVIWQALEVAELSSFVQSLPLQLDAPIESYGSNLSGGQRQRLALARAVMRQPEVLVIDDALSGLDNQTLKRVLENIRAIPSLSIILIAQQVSHIRHCDNVVVLEQGRQVAQGTHEELCTTSDVYQEIVQSQGEEEKK